MHIPKNFHLSCIQSVPRVDKSPANPLKGVLTDIGMDSRQGHQTPSISEFLLPSSYPMIAPLKSPLTPKFGMAFISGRSENTVMEQRP